MKMMRGTCYTTYNATLRALRARGQRLDFLRMGLAADLALAVEEGDPDRAAELAERLGLDLEELDEVKRE